MKSPPLILLLVVLLLYASSRAAATEAGSDEPHHTNNAQLAIDFGQRPAVELLTPGMTISPKRDRTFLSSQAFLQSYVLPGVGDASMVLEAPQSKMPAIIKTGTVLKIESVSTEPHELYGKTMLLHCKTAHGVPVNLRFLPPKIYGHGSCVAPKYYFTPPLIKDLSRVVDIDFVGGRTPTVIE